ncbi:Trans-zeatin O-beta-D-glucosyltransferase [Bertholletia excelsa]
MFQVGNCGLDVSAKAQVAVVMVPFPAQGHLNQLLHLSRLINSYHVPVHYVSSATHSRQAKLRVHGWNPLAATTTLHFHSFPTPISLASPQKNDVASNTKFPSVFQASVAVASHLRRPVAHLLRSLSRTCRRVVVIHDSLMASVVQDVASIPNAESYSFHSVSAFAMFFFFWEALGRPIPVEPMILQDLPSLDGCFSGEFIKFIGEQHKQTKLVSGRLYNTTRVLEGPFLDLLAREEISGMKKQWAIGPFNPVTVKISPAQRHKCLEWLDEQAPNSVIYVSFGTSTSFSDDQIKELAVGLQRSRQKFIWVLRVADEGNGLAGEARSGQSQMLPEGFEKRVEGRGMIVRDWAPQLDILGHPSTGGFMSHCGWNSCMESLTMGVPIAAWPMHSDQPRNMVLVTKLLKVGLVVKDWAQRDEVVVATTVEKAVRTLMSSREGDDMRRRAMELGGAVRHSVTEGGISRAELDSFVAHITR